MTKYFLKFTFLILILGVFFAGSYTFANNKQNVNSIAYAENLPTSYCMRDEYYMPTENQHNQGLCWAFAATNTFSSAVLKSTNQYINYSEGWVSARYADINPTFTPGGAGTIYSFNGVNDIGGGIVQEQDFNYQDSYHVSKENVGELVDYYSQYIDSQIVKNYKHTKFEISRGDDKLEQRALIKNHIYTQSGLYLSCKMSVKTTNISGKKYFYKDPTVAMSGSLHALCVIGWDDNFQVEYGGVTYQGAWITLNEYGNNDTDSDQGIIYFLYDDPYYTELVGYTYQENLDDIYFYNTLTNSSASFESNLAKVCEGSGQSMKQKNVFVPSDDIELVYSYKISPLTIVSDIKIFNLQTDVTNKFAITNDTDTNTIIITGQEQLDLGSYKIVFEYQNTNNTEKVTGAFYIIDGTETEYIYMNVSPYSYGMLNYEYQGINIAGTTYNKNLVLTAQQITGTVNMTVYMSTYSKVTKLVVKNQKAGTEIQTEVSEPANQKSISFSYNYSQDAESFVANYELYVISQDTTRLINLYIHYSSDVFSNFLTRINYGLDGGQNAIANRATLVISKSKNTILRVPTKAGYNFEGWYYSKDFDENSKVKLLYGNYYLEYSHVIHETTNTAYWYNTSASGDLSFYVINVYAKWTKQDSTYQISVICQGGQISESGAITVAEGDDKIFTISCEEDYCLYQVYIDNNLMDNKIYGDYIKNGIAFNNVTSNHILVVIFVPKTEAKYNITIEDNSNGQITCEQSLVDVTYGETRTFTAVASKGYSVFEVTANDEAVEMQDNEFSIVVTCDVNLKLILQKLPTFTITILELENGQITCEQELTEILSGETRTFLVAPNKDYKVTQVTANDEEVELENNQFTIIVTQNVIIDATFEEIPKFTVTVEQGENGIVSSEEELTNVYSGETRTFKVTADQGYKVKFVKVNDEEVEIQENRFTITVTQDVTITAEFEEIPEEPKKESNIVLPIIIASAAVAFVGMIVAFVIKIKKSREF